MSVAVLGFGRVCARGQWRGADHTPWPQAPGETLPLRARMFSDEPYPHFGRMDPLCKVGVAAAALALADAGEHVLAHADIAQVGGTRRGCVSADGVFEDSRVAGAPSPASFVYTLPSMYLGEIAIRFGLQGRCTLLTTGRLAGLLALATGVGWIEAGRAGQVLVTAADDGAALAMLLGRGGTPRFTGAAFRVPEGARMLEDDGLLWGVEAQPGGTVGARADGQEVSIRVLDQVA
jgi:3-oxoacyl-(acyl-carrier-protein) synthase